MEEGNVVRVNGVLAVLRRVDEDNMVLVEFMFESEHFNAGQELWLSLDEDVWTRDDTGEEVTLVA